jgi:hypothetical protein
LLEESKRPLAAKAIQDIVTRILDSLQFAKLQATLDAKSNHDTDVKAVDNMTVNLLEKYKGVLEKARQEQSERVSQLKTEIVKTNQKISELNNTLATYIPADKWDEFIKIMQEAEQQVAAANVAAPGATVAAELGREVQEKERRLDEERQKLDNIQAINIDPLPA